MRNWIKFEKQRNDRKVKEKRKRGMAEARVDIQVNNCCRRHRFAWIELPSMRRLSSRELCIVSLESLYLGRFPSPDR